MGRIRIRTVPPSIGEFSNDAGTIVSVRDNGTERCDDTVGYRNLDHALLIAKDKIEGGIANGSAGPPNYRSWHDYPCTPINPSNVDPPTLTESMSSLAVKAVNLTSPWREQILLPAFLTELRDIPAMIRHAGRILTLLRELGDNYHGLYRGFGDQYFSDQLRKQFGPSGIGEAKEFAAANLAVQFGWAPLISDLGKIQDFSSSVESRKKEFERLYSGQGLRRKITYQNETKVTILNSYVVQSATFVYTQTVSVRSSRRTWATVRWKPTANLPLPPSDSTIRNMLTGISTRGAILSAWELLPWSFMIDYFVNIGDALELNLNNAGPAVYKVNTMSKLDRTITYPAGVKTLADGGISISAYKRTRKERVRIPGFTSGSPLQANLPILSGAQLSILGSLAMLNAGKL